jgi:hypothetical protein
MPVLSKKQELLDELYELLVYALAGEEFLAPAEDIEQLIREIRLI